MAQERYSSNLTERYRQKYACVPEFESRKYGIASRYVQQLNRDFSGHDSPANLQTALHILCDGCIPDDTNVIRADGGPLHICGNPGEGDRSHFSNFTLVGSGFRCVSLVWILLGGTELAGVLRKMKFDLFHYAYSVEQVFHLDKAFVALAAEYVEPLRTATSPDAAKKLGRCVPGLNLIQWDSSLSVMVMLKCLAERCSADAKFRCDLAGARESCANIVEARESDRIWGVGVSHTDARDYQRRGGVWNGKNLLGFCLEVIGDMLIERPRPDLKLPSSLVDYIRSCFPRPVHLS
jgi:ribA/ribD-fused uncharacterized protein